MTILQDDHVNKCPPEEMPLASVSAQQVKDKLERDKRLKDRELANSSWQYPTILDSEIGRRDMIRAVLPRCDMSDEQLGVFQALNIALDNLAGGFTVQESFGRWSSQFERTKIYEISFQADEHDMTARKIAREFYQAGHDLGETWVHVEHHRNAFVAMHARVR